MSSDNTTNKNDDPEDVELMNFLIAKTKDAKSPLIITQLAREFKEKSGSSQEVSYFASRINEFRSKIHQMDSIDTATKVKLIFALSVSINEDFLKELQKDAHVEIDKDNRIIKYRANDRSLESYDVLERVELMNFLIEKSKDAKSPLSISQLAQEFKEKSGSLREVICIVSRMDKFRSKIHQMDSIDTETKVKMMFALSVSIDEDFLNELRKDARVEVDQKNRIIKYRAKYESIELEGYHCHAAQMTDASKLRADSQENSDDGSQESVPKTPGSVKRPATEMPNSSKRAKDSSPAGSMKSKDDAPDDSDRIPESRARELSNPGIQQLRQPKVEDAPEAPITTESEADDGYTPNAPISRVQQLSQPTKQIKMGSEKSQEGFADGSINPIPKTPGSMKRVATEVPSSSKRAKDSSPAAPMKSDNHAPDDSARIPESRARRLSNPGIPEDSDDGSIDPIPKTPEFVKRAAAAEVSNTSKEAKDSPPDNSARIPESRVGDVVRGSSPQPPISRVQQLLKPTQQIKMGSEKSQEDSADGSIDPTPKTSGSVKRSATEMPNSSKRAKDSSPAGSMKSKDDAPYDSARIPESRARELSNPGIQEDSEDRSQESTSKTPGSVKRSAAEVPRAKDSSSAASKESEDHAPDDSARIPESRARRLSNPGIPEDSDDGSIDPIPKTPGSVKRSTAEVPSSSKRTKDSSPAGSMKSENHAPNDSAKTRSGFLTQGLIERRIKQLIETDEQAYDVTLLYEALQKRRPDQVLESFSRIQIVREISDIQKRMIRWDGEASWNTNILESEKEMKVFILFSVMKNKSPQNAFNILKKAMSTVEFPDFQYWFYRFSNGNLDLDHDRSKDQKTRGFSDMPIDVVENVVKHLGFLERIIARKVNPRMRIVSSLTKCRGGAIGLEIYSKQAALLLNTTRITYRSSGYGVEGWRRSSKKRQKAPRQPMADFAERSFNDLVSILKHPSWEFESLTLNSQSSAKLDTFLASSVLPMFNLSRLEIEADTMAPIVGILKHTSSKRLSSLGINCRNLNFNAFKKVLDFPQWNQIRQLSIQKIPEGFPLAIFEGMEKLRIEQMVITREDLTVIRDNFIGSAKFDKLFIRNLPECRDFADKVMNVFNLHPRFHNDRFIMENHFYEVKITGNILEIFKK